MNQDKIVNPLDFILGFNHQSVTTVTNGETIALAGVTAFAFLMSATAYTSGTAKFKLQVTIDDAAWVDLDSDYKIDPGGVEQTLGAIDTIAKLGASGLNAASLLLTNEQIKSVRVVQTETVVMDIVGFFIASRDKR